MKQKELRETALVDLYSQVEARARQGCRIALYQLLRPVQEIRAAVVHFQSAEKRVIVQPVSLFRTKPIKLRPQCRMR